MKVLELSTGQVHSTEYGANKQGNLRMWVNGKFYSDRMFYKLFREISKETGIAKLFWSDLNDSQKEEFTKMLINTGDRDAKDYPKHIYQIKDGRCHGWIWMGTKYKSFCPVINP